MSRILTLSLQLCLASLAVALNSAPAASTTTRQGLLAIESSSTGSGPAASRRPTPTWTSGSGTRRPARSCADGTATTRSGFPSSPAATEPSCAARPRPMRLTISSDSVPPSPSFSSPLPVTSSTPVPVSCVTTSHLAGIKAVPVPIVHGGVLHPLCAVVLAPRRAGEARRPTSKF